MAHASILSDARGVTLPTLVDAADGTSLRLAEVDMAHHVQRVPQAACELGHGGKIWASACPKLMHVPSSRGA